MSEPRQLGPHPDADRLSAFMEGALAGPERQACLAHLAECRECRDVVFLAQQAVPVPLAQPARLPMWRRWAPPLSVAAAVAACGVVAVLWLRPHTTPGAAPSPIANERAIAPPSGGSGEAPEAAPLRPAPPADSRSMVAAQKTYPAPLPARNAPSTGVNGMTAGAAAHLPPPAAPPAGSAVSNDEAKASVAARGAETPSLTAGPLAGAATGAGQAEGAVAAERANSLDHLMSRPATALNGALQQSPAQSSLRAASGGLHLTIEHNQGPDNGLSAIRGTVTDASGATIAQASISLRASSGATVATATSDELGRFAVAAVTPGQYELQVSARGFQTDAERVDLQARDLALLSPTLQVGAAAQSVEVTADAAPIATTAKPTDAQLGAMVPVLPGKVAAKATAVSDGRMLALDTSGTLYLSRDAGQHWKKIRPVWTGSVAHLALARPAEASAFKLKEKADGTASSMFELTTTDGAVWISSDGTHWRLR